MGKFVENVNVYLNQMKIKQTYLSMLTGIEKNKLSRILNGVQDISGKDMEIIADALGLNVAFFVSDSFSVPVINSFGPEKVAFYAGEPTEKQELIANQLIELMANIDEVISAESRFMNMFKG